MKFRLVPALLILVAMAITIRLGFWQRDRAHQKEAIEARIEQFEHAPPQTVTKAPIAAGAIEYHRVRAYGRFMPEHVVYLDNRPYRDQPGFYVVMPLALTDGGHVLVNRGWLPRNADVRTAIAPYRTPTGDVWVEGIARTNASRAFELGEGGSAPRQAIRQNLDVDAFSAETHLQLQSFVIQQTNDTGDALVRDWPAPTLGVERNYGYMLQWWGMAAAALVFGLYAARRAARKPTI
ncbi:SURF1 family protein [Trinickia caryophylli]|uniref:SURF1-like protein n=1 Tax=Trinickia caryophylli TaxID=28094 RepID=A0A1X7EQG2_TRICW|nr:SURF1 family protein [Trinickia caryophylli]PMS10210.1 SURF1 family protein [Trinickia caryophylli]TRX18680.1 SURF1 family protein [Trinickia caryophylli]WQE10523.1 SURF1 family protein [Trinickia caryophylli]SMF38091.1 Cytochrome oxidase assembly protein ShyY1 [Trinickia caryophylli]GLU32878.1 SURF1-like protein [Trinickia caryophylli]